MSKIITVLSSVAGNGSKFIATELAYHLKEKIVQRMPNYKDIIQKEKRSPVLLIDFNFNQPYLCKSISTDLERGLDTLLPHMANKNIPDVVFKRSIELLDVEVDVLKGFGSANQHNAINDSQVTTILNKAKDMYEIVIVVVELTVNNAATPRTLFLSDEICLVMRNNTVNLLALNETLKTLQWLVADKEINVVYNFQGEQVLKPINESFAKSGLNIKVLADFPYEASAEDNKNIKNKGGVFNRNPIYENSNKLASYFMNKNL